MPYTHYEMEIIETAPFARCRDDLFDDEQFREFEEHLVLNPAGGALSSVTARTSAPT